MSDKAVLMLSMMLVTHVKWLTQKRIKAKKLLITAGLSPSAVGMGIPLANISLIPCNFHRKTI